MTDRRISGVDVTVSIERITGRSSPYSIFGCSSIERGTGILLLNTIAICRNTPNVRPSQE